MKTFCLMTCLLFISNCFCSEEKPPLSQKTSLSSDKKNIKIPTRIIDLLSIESISDNDIQNLTSFLSQKVDALHPVEAVDKNGFSLLMYAAQSKCAQIRRLVYTFNPEINRVCKGRTALFQATTCHHPESLEIMHELIEQKANIELGWDNITPGQAIEDQLNQAHLNLASYNHSPYNGTDHSDALKKEKATALLTIKLFNEKKKLLAKMHTSLQK